MGLHLNTNFEHQNRYDHRQFNKKNPGNKCVIPNELLSIDHVFNYLQFHLIKPTWLYRKPNTTKPVDTQDRSAQPNNSRSKIEI